MKLVEAINALGKPVKGAKVLVLGVAYKKDVDDVRESPALKVVEQMREWHMDVAYHDPYIPGIPGPGMATWGCPRFLWMRKPSGNMMRYLF